MGKLRPRDGQHLAKVNQQWLFHERGRNPEGVETPRRSQLGPFVPLPAVDGTREPTVPPRELDGYLDSLFDPVLACGDAVGM